MDETLGILLLSIILVAGFCVLACQTDSCITSIREGGRQADNNDNGEFVSTQRAQQGTNHSHPVYTGNSLDSRSQARMERIRAQMQGDIESFGVSVEGIRALRAQVLHDRASAGVTSTVSNDQMNQMHEKVKRKKLIRSKLHYQIVLPDLSNVNIESLRAGSSTKEEDDTLTGASLDDVDDHSTIEYHHGKEESLYHRVQDLFSLRSLRPRKKDICSVCLEGFQPGQTICAARNSCCSHIHHDECLRGWLMEHDDCPLCRSKIMI